MLSATSSGQPCWKVQHKFHYILVRGVKHTLITELYYSTIAPFYHIRSKERSKYDAVLHCRTERIRTKSTEQQNDRRKWKQLTFLNNDLCTRTSSLTEQIETSKGIWMVSFVLFSSFARVLCEIDTIHQQRRSQDVFQNLEHYTRKWNNFRIIHPLLYDLTYNTFRHFVHCS